MNIQKEFNNQPGEAETNDLVKAIRELLADARYIIDKVDEFEMSLKLAGHCNRPHHDRHNLTPTERIETP